jgi:hypothetical protein
MSKNADILPAIQSHEWLPNYMHSWFLNPQRVNPKTGRKHYLISPAD